MDFQNFDSVPIGYYESYPELKIEDKIIKVQLFYLESLKWCLYLYRL